MSNSSNVSDKENKLRSLLGESSSFTDMTASERKYFAEILKEESERRKLANTPIQVREIVPMDEFLSPAYLGPDAENIYPYWRDFLCNVFDKKREEEGRRINQVILSGSIGVGKSTIAEILLLRKLYELSCYKNINAKFKLMSTASIMFLYFSINKDTANATGFGSIRAWVDSSPYFRNNFPRKQRIDSLLVFPEGVTIAYGSRSSDAIGRNLICSIMDEANFLSSSGDNKSGNIEKALEMFAGMVNRSNSRFIIDGGDNYSLNILVSSSTHENSATEQQIRNSVGDEHTISAAPSQWEVKPDKFSKKYFYVFKGNNYMDPCIVESTDDVNNVKISLGMKKNNYLDGLSDLESIEKIIESFPPHQRDMFLKVPEELKHGFEINLIRSLQDLGGVSVQASGKLFTSPVVYNNCIDSKLSHPFLAPEIVISTGDTIEIRDYLRDNWSIRCPERPRYIHIDQSYRTDSTGITSIYLDSIIEEEGVKKPVFAVDFMLRINPPKPPRKIAIYKIRNFVVYLANVVNMKIGKVTYDIFNSEESRQILEEMGLNVGYQSVDRTDKAYLDLVEIMYEGRLKIYDSPILRHELFNLVHYRDKRKVDHPKTVQDSSYDGKGSSVGSKDLSDSLAGALENALQVNISVQSGDNGTLDSFLGINSYTNGLNNRFDFDSMSVEEMIDRQIDSMIDDFELSGGGYYSGVNGFQF